MEMRGRQQRKTYKRSSHCCMPGLVMVLFILFSLPLNAMAEREKFVLDFDDSRIEGRRGAPTPLFLKKELRRQYPGIDVTELQLHEVIVVAKSRKGRGEVQLKVGPESSSLYRIEGHPRQSYRSDSHSFSRVSIINPFPQSWGPWQLLVSGNVTVRKVIVVVEDRPRPQYKEREKRYSLQDAILEIIAAGLIGGDNKHYRKE